MSAFAMISLGSTEFWVAGQDAGRHLEQGLALARQVGQPYLEFTGLALQSEADLYESLRVAAEHATAAIGLARRYGWESDPAFGVACMSAQGTSSVYPSQRLAAIVGGGTFRGS